MGGGSRVGSIVAAVAFASMLTAGTNAYADATLTLTPVASECVTTVLGANGFPTTTVTPCTVPVGVFTHPVIGRRGSVIFREGSFLRLVYDFTYTDDGLALPAPTALDPTLPSAPLVSFEAGIVSVSVDGQMRPDYMEFEIGVGPSAPTAGIDSYAGYAVFGLNDHPDQISGRLYVTVGVPAVGDTSGTITNVAVNTHVAAVPEPSTYALMAIGLAAVGAATRRRRRNDPSRNDTSLGQATA